MSAEENKERRWLGCPQLLAWVMTMTICGMLMAPASFHDAMAIPFSAGSIRMENSCGHGQKMHRGRQDASLWRVWSRVSVGALLRWRPLDVMDLGTPYGVRMRGREPVEVTWACRGARCAGVPFVSGRQPSTSNG